MINSFDEDCLYPIRQDSDVICDRRYAGNLNRTADSQRGRSIGSSVREVIEQDPSRVPPRWSSGSDSIRPPVTGICALGLSIQDQALEGVPGGPSSTVGSYSSSWSLPSKVRLATMSRATSG